MQEVYGDAYAAGCIYAPVDFAKKYPNTAQAIVNAMVRALRFIQQSTPEQIVATVPPEYYTDKALYTAALKANLDGFKHDGNIPMAASQAVYKDLKTLIHALHRYRRNLRPRKGVCDPGDGYRAGAVVLDIEPEHDLTLRVVVCGWSSQWQVSRLAVLDRLHAYAEIGFGHFCSSDEYGLSIVHNLIFLQVLTFVPALLFCRAGKNVVLSPKAEIRFRTHHCWARLFSAESRAHDLLTLVFELCPQGVVGRRLLAMGRADADIHPTIGSR